MSHTQENATDMHPATTVKGKYTDLVKNIKSPSLHELLSTGRRLLCFWFVTSLKTNLCTALTTKNTTENKCIVSQAKHSSTSAQCVFNRNTSVTGHKIGRVGLSHRHQTPRSTTNSTVSTSILSN
jgi:hypothetical protein